MNEILCIRGLSKQFGERRALREIELVLEPGTITVLLGANGAGKSTLLRSILGLVEPDRGEIHVLGRDARRRPRDVRRSIGYVPDQPDAYGWMTARDLFRFLRDQYPTWNGERAETLLERLRAPQCTPFDALSRGEAAKVMLAAALAPASPLLLLDEPFARLAAHARDEVLRVFIEEAPSDGGAVLLATHELDVAARIADRVVVLDEGRIVADRPSDELVDSGSERGFAEQLRALCPNAQEAPSR